MKKFKKPSITVIQLESELITESANCWEEFDCQKCYETANICSSGVSCDGLICPCLGSLHI